MDDPWTDELISRLCESWIAGKSMSCIGRELHKSRNSVSGKIDRLKKLGILAGRPSPILRDVPNKARRSVPRIVGATLLPMRSEIAAPLMEAVVVRKIEPKLEPEAKPVRRQMAPFAVHRHRIFRA